MHLVKALQPTTAEDITGELVSWGAQQVRPVQEDMVNWYASRPTVFEYLGFKDFGADGSGSLNFDSNGNLIANIIPRTDTYAGLVTSAVSGGGEIASPTDRPTIVKFHGVEGTGVAYEFSPLPYNTITYSGGGFFVYSAPSAGNSVSLRTPDGNSTVAPAFNMEIVGEIVNWG